MGDAADSMASPIPSPPLDTEALQKHLTAHLRGCDLTTLSLKRLRRELEQRIGLPEGGLDDRKAEIKSGAAAFAQSAMAAPPVPTPQQVEPLRVEPVSAATVDPSTVAPASAHTAALAATGGDPAGEPPAAKKRKAPRAASAFTLWAADNLPRIREELSRNGMKPGLADFAKAKSKGWNDTQEDIKQEYARKAAEVNAQNPTAESVKAPAPKRPRAPGVANGGGGDSRRNKRPAATSQAETPVMTRAEFVRGAPRLNVRLSPEVAGGAGVPGVGTNGDGGAAQPALWSFVADPRVFSSGAVGYYAAGAVSVCVQGRAAPGKVQVTILLPNSKLWENGEGFGDLPARGATEEAENPQEPMATAAPAEAADDAEDDQPKEEAASADAPRAVETPCGESATPVEEAAADVGDVADKPSIDQRVAPANSSDCATAQTG